MNLGMSLLEEGAEGVKEIPSVNNEVTTAEEMEVVKPIEEPPVVNEVSLEELVEMKCDLMKQQGVNKDFMVSMEALMPGFMKENKLILNGFTECLSKVNFEQVSKSLDLTIAKEALTKHLVSMESMGWDEEALIKESIPDNMKAKWNKETKAYENLTEEDLVAFGKVIIYKTWQNIKNAPVYNNALAPLLGGAGEIRYVQGVPVVVKPNDPGPDATEVPSPETPPVEEPPVVESSPEPEVVIETPVTE